MELTLCDSKMVPTDILDTYVSMIWTDKYIGSGDFQVTLPVSAKIASNLLLSSYLILDESEHVMIIEDFHRHTDSEAGNTITVKGRSLESIIDRRIVWSQTVLGPGGNLQDGIAKLLNENAINPSDASRRLTRLVFEASTDPKITSLTIDKQYLGDNIYTVINDLCTANEIGFKITLNDSGNFVFNLYVGVDRSYSQFKNPYVLFSPSFENIVNGDYDEDNTSLKTVTLIGGEGDGPARVMTTAECATGAGSDLDRREMFTDAKSVSKTVQGGTLTDAQYIAQLKQKGAEDLSKNVLVKTFDGTVSSASMYVFGKDFFMGDIVQIENEYGDGATSRITEMIYSEDNSNIVANPTYTTIV